MQAVQPSSYAELFRLAVIFVHLIACCVAIGMVLLSDVAMVKQLFKGTPSRPSAERKHMRELQNVVSIALAVLWATGFVLVTFDTYFKGWQYFANPKLQAKILIVVFLTINGAVLHHRVLPYLLKAGSLLNLSFGQAMFAIFTGSVSGVSWFYAAMLGVGRPLSWKYSLIELMAAYPVLIASGVFFMVVVIAGCKYRIAAQTPRDYFSSHGFTASENLFLGKH
jgi:hypothetical protein